MSDYWTRVVARILPDMRREVSRWTVLKNHDSLPTVPGDIDLCLHRSDWELFTQHLGKALSQCGNFMMLVCDHYLGVRLVFVVPTDRPYVDSALELDLADGIWWKGHQLVEAAEIVRAGLDDPRGFKGAPPGTEAGFHLTIQVLDRFGRLRQGARPFQRLDDLAHQDPFGFCAAMERMHGPIGRRA